MKLARRIPVLWLLLCLAPLSGAADEKERQDVILRAMQAELDRSRQLRLVSLDPPYYIEYSLHDGESVSISGTLGALVAVAENRFRQPGVQVRVGNPAFDNTNYIFSDFAFGARYNLGQMPLDNNYLVLRRHLWLATDHAYKSALQAIARKRAALKHFTVAEEVPDFSEAEPFRAVGEIKRVEVSEEEWRNRVRSLSALFARYPRVTDSRIEFQAVQSTHYFVNSEGTQARVPETLIFMQVKGAARAPDGMMLRDAVVFQARDPAYMASETEMQRGILSVAENLTALAEAPLGDPYSGPVLFEGQAAAQLFAEVLGRNLSLRRRPVSEPGRPVPFVESELQGRTGARILPEWIDVVDDPTQKEWRGRPLFGHYLVDLEGVPPKPLDLVKGGVLQAFLMTRQPVADLAGSNGRARLPGRFGAKSAAFGNLFVRASEGVSLEDLKQRLIELCKRRNRPYGLIVRKTDFPSSASVEEFRRMAAGLSQPGGGGQPVSLPLLVYRLYPDGREELVRGLRFRDLSTRSLRDIDAASLDSHVFEFLENGAPFALMGAGRFVAESSVVAPSVLFEELQLDRFDQELPNPPVVPPPPLLSLR